MESPARSRYANSYVGDLLGDAKDGGHDLVVRSQPARRRRSDARRGLLASARLNLHVTSVSKRNDR